MKITRGLHNLRSGGESVLTIGNFDGVHRGHLAILGRLCELARAHRAPARLLTFEPHPRELLEPRAAPARLTRFREKMHLLGATGVDEVVCQRFEHVFASMPPERFIDDVLVGAFRVRHLLVGDDFRFGRGGRGDFALLDAARERHDFELSRFATVAANGGRVSSTGVRASLENGALDVAEQLLGRPYSVCGRVAAGQRVGRTIGFPTANIALARNRSPLAGVFAVRLVDRGGVALAGVANVGRRPTVDGTEERVEVHVLDFDGDLYGREFRVEFLHRVRAERRFAGLDALQAQIAADVATARAYFAAARGG